MKFNRLFKLPFFVLKKINGKLFFLIQKRRLNNVNLKKGINCSIHHSAILLTSDKGIINLKDGTYIGRNVELDTSGELTIGKNASIQDRCIILGDVEIGEYCVFAPNVYISSGRHYYNHIPEFYIKDQDRLILSDENLKAAHSKKVIIEDDCWIGINVVIMSGVTIGKGSIIGANSVVTKNIAPYTVAAGSPAKFIKKRLNFKPKKSLQYNNDTDLPYFYKGFFIDKINLDIDRTEGGIAISFKFVICVDSGSSNQLIINIKKNTGSTISLNYNGQKVIVIGNEFLDVIFDIANSEYHYITIELENNKIETIEKIAYVNHIVVC